MWGRKRQKKLWVDAEKYKVEVKEAQCCGQPFRVSSIGRRTMTNVKTEIRGKILTITVDLSKEHGQSKSGKSTIIATTGGNVKLGEDGGIAFGLNVYKK